MKKMKYFIDYEKEEKWLMEMAQKGYLMTGKSLTYHFREVEPENSVIKIDYRIFKSKNDYHDYLTLFEDSGWHHLAGSKNSGEQYFKKTGEKGTDDIFSDSLSKAGRYQRASRFWGSMAISVAVILIALVVNGAIEFKTILNPRLFYLTPGLWQMSGSQFWRAFWFETPFAVFRAVLFFPLPAFLILYLYFSVRAKQLYHRDKKSRLIGERSIRHRPGRLTFYLR